MRGKGLVCPAEEELRDTAGACVICCIKQNTKELRYLTFIGQQLRKQAGFRCHVRDRDELARETNTQTKNKRLLKYLRLQVDHLQATSFVVEKTRALFRFLQLLSTLLGIIMRLEQFLKDLSFRENG